MHATFSRSRFWHLLVLCVFGLSLRGTALRAAASTDDDAAEAQEAAAEEEAQHKQEMARDRPLIESAEGRLILRDIPDPAKPPVVVGTLSTAKGQIYQIKLLRPEVLPALIKANGQNVHLIGNFRNKRKYFVASGVSLLDDKGRK